MIDRAAQFAPFAALTGYDDAVKETGRLTDDATELPEYVKANINDKLRIIMESIDIKPEISITYFVPDSKKAGGAYTTVTGVVKSVEEYERTVILTDKTVIPMDRIYAIEGEIFDSFDFDE
jgi:hypothetical protein